MNVQVPRNQTPGNQTPGRKINHPLLGSAAALALFAAGPASAGIVIDSFDEVSAAGIYPLTLNSVGFYSVTETDLGSVLGGRRTTRLTVTSVGAGPDNGEITVAPLPLGVLDFTSSSTVEGSAMLKYDGAITDFSAQNLEIDFISFDHATGQDMDVIFTLREGSNTLTQTFTLISSITSPETIVFEASMFAGTANLAAIDTIEVDFIGGLATDFRIDEIRSMVIPAPATFALAGVAGLVAISRRRFRRG